jgi:hypothetical protein
MTAPCLHNCRTSTGNQRIRVTTPPPAGSRPAPSGSAFRRATTTRTYPVALRSVGILAGTTTRRLPVSRAPFGREEGWDQHGEGTCTGKACHRSDSHRSFPAVLSPGARSSSCLVPSSSLQPVLPACTCIVHPDSVMVERR